MSRQKNILFFSLESLMLFIYLFLHIIGVTSIMMAGIWFLNGINLIGILFSILGISWIIYTYKYFDKRGWEDPIFFMPVVITIISTLLIFSILYVFFHPNYATWKYLLLDPIIDIIKYGGHLLR